MTLLKRKTKAPKQAKVNGGGGAKQFLSKVSGAFMLPISVMAIAGLFLGVGAAIASNAGDNHTLEQFGSFIKNMGDPVFGAMPTLFAAAIVVAFTDEAGVGVFAAIIGMLIFSALQGVFITSVDHTTAAATTAEGFTATGKDGILSGVKNIIVNPATTGTIDHAALKTAIGALDLPKSITPTAGTTYTLTGHLSDVVKASTAYTQVSDVNAGLSGLYKNGATTMPTFDFNAPFGLKDNHDGFKVLFSQAGRDAGSMEHLIATTLGIQSLNTSIFGGIAVGATVAFLYNKFHTIQLPQVISFFGGKRFVSLVVIIAMIPMAFLFLLFWPWIGKGLSWLGNNIGKVPYGFDSFIFGVIERSLIPFGLHHVFYAPLWWTNAGGDAAQQLSTFHDSFAGATDVASNGIGRVVLGSLVNDKAAFTQALTTSGAGKDSLVLSSVMAADKAAWLGDSFTWLAANGLKSDSLTWMDQVGTLHSEKVFPFFAHHLDLNLGRFMQGKFPFMIFALPAAGAAMVMAAPKENRKMAFGTVFPAALTAFVTGVTEPIEFTFLFLAPWLFWGFHAIMAGVSFLIMNVVHAHVGMTFSGGFLDLMIYGAIPFGKGTGFWWAFVIGPCLVPLYYAVFYFSIKKFDLDTPGRGENTKLFTKADFKAKKAGAKNGLRPQSAAIVAAFGGWDNITSFTNCATRLRYDVKDASLVDTAALKAAGAAGVAKVGSNHFQAIMGPQAEQINTNIKGNRGADLGGAAAAPVAAAPVKAVSKVVSVKAVSTGTVKALSSMDNGAFAVMGKGVAISPTSKTTKSQKYYAPFAGEVSLVFPTKHAYGITSTNGVEVLVHIGVDTVKLDGKGFKAHVKQGDKVKAGQLIGEADLSVISKQVPSVDTAIVVTSGQAITAVLKGKATKASTIFKTK